MNEENTHDRVRMIISGRVQGVGYRSLVKTAADSAAVHGTVRNLADGTVEVCAEAEQEVLTAFVGVVYRAAPQVDVRDMDIEWTAGDGSWTEFRIEP